MTLVSWAPQKGQCMGLESVVRRDGHGSASDRQDKATALLLYKPAIAVQEAVRAITFSRSARPAAAARRLRQPTQRTTDGSRRAEHRTPFQTAQRTER